jgi:hypothetical protein
MTDDIETILFGFLQAAFFATTPSNPAPDFGDAIERLLRHRTLRVDSFLSWPEPARIALKEMLKSWLIVERLHLERGQPLPYPPGFASGSSSTRLGEPFIAYILERADSLLSLYQDRQQTEQDRAPEG